MVRISVITPLFNAAPHIAECIASVAAQGESDIEHLIIDNRSTDGGPQIVQDLLPAHPHLRLLSRPDRQGAAPARNAGLHAAKGRWIAFLDADDQFLQGKLSTQIKAMQERQLGFSWTAYQCLRHGQFWRNQPAAPDPRLDDLLMKSAVIGCSTVMLDRNRLGDGHRFDEGLTLAEDFALWLRIAGECHARGIGFGGIPEILTAYSATGGTSRQKWRAAQGHWRALRHGLGLDRRRAARAMAGYIRHAIRDRLG